VKALADNVQVKLKALGATVQGVEGARSAEWILIDLGSVVVHVMLPAVRAHYNLEELWNARPARKSVRRRNAAEADARSE
jgi:ribosome-associated protein